jgi:UDP-N-acetylglucosamine transferase subunit ALG13
VTSADPSSATTPLVFVTVGGDHHPFQRLLTWVEDWLAEGAAERVRCFVQYGPLTLPAGATGSAYLDHADLVAHMAEAHVVVSSGGPATLTEARKHGHVPITVPRRRALGEHVDDHQVAFTSRLGAAGHVVVAHTEEQFRSALETALDGPPRPRRDTGDDGKVSQTITSIGDIIDATATRSRTWRRRPPRPVAVSGSQRPA